MRTLPTFLVGENILRAWCDKCGRYHTHGAAYRGLKGGGERLSHCDGPEPAKDYYLVVIGVAPVDIQNDLKRRKPLGPDVVLRKK